MGMETSAGFLTASAISEDLAAAFSADSPVATIVTKTVSTAGTSVGKSSRTVIVLLLLVLGYFVFLR